MYIVMGDFTDIDVDALDLLGLNILNNLLVLTQEINGDIEHIEDKNMMIMIKLPRTYI